MAGIFEQIQTFRTETESGIDSAQTSATTAQSATEALSGYFNTPRSVPSWMGAQADDVAFDVDKIDGTTAPTIGQVVLIPVKVVQDRIYDAIKFGIAATAMTNCYVGLYATDLTTGDLTKVLDLGDCKAQLDTTYNQQTIDIPDPAGVQRGEVYYIGVLQVGGTAAAMHRSSLTTNFTTGLYPRFRGNVYATGGQTSLPSSITSANVNSGVRFWGALGTAADPVTPGLVFLSDSFNRASLGSAWTVRSGSVVLSSNKPIKSGFSDGVATHNTRLTSQSQKVGCTLPAIGQDNMIFLRGNGSGPRVAMYAFDTSGTKKISIVTFSGAYSSSSFTTRATVTASGGLAGNWTFEAIGSVYTAYKDGVLVTQWSDSGGAFSYGSSNTEVGIAPAGGSANALDDWFAQDL